MKNRIIFILLTILYIGATGFFSKLVVDEMDTFKTNKVAYSKKLNLQETLMDPRDYLFSSEYSGSESEAGQFYGKADLAKQKGQKYAIYIAVLAVLYILIVLLLYYKRYSSLAHFGLSITVVSTLFLTLGVFAPMVEISAYLDGLHIPLNGGWKDIPFFGQYLPDTSFSTSVDFDGKLYAFYQCKSIINIIGILFKTENFFIAIAIMLFSVVFPLIKLGFTTLFLLSKTARKKQLFVNIVSYVGKFSMADVFVVAVFLSLQAIQGMSTAVAIEAKTLVGIYFFTFYCILSIGVFYVIKAMKKQLPITAVNGDKVITDLDQEIIY